MFFCFYRLYRELGKRIDGLFCGGIIGPENARVTSFGIPSARVNLIERSRGMETEVTFEIVRHIGDICQYPSGWTKELNRVSWNHGPAKLDIREWDESHRFVSRGSTLTDEEAKVLMGLLKEEFGT